MIDVVAGAEKELEGEMTSVQILPVFHEAPSTGKEETTPRTRTADT